MEELHLVGRMLDVLHGAWIGKPGDWLCFFLSSSTSRSRVLDTEKDTCKSNFIIKTKRSLSNLKISGRKQLVCSVFKFFLSLQKVLFCF
jgi:hypothetical protein